MPDRHICQVAFCARNAADLRQWYKDVFELAAGSGALLTVPPMPTHRIQGIQPNPSETVTWLVDQQDYFQLEFFQFHRPKSRLKPVDWRPCDLGYSIVGIVVTDFELTLHQYVAYSERPLPVSIGEEGSRRACVQDPEGNWVAILERDPLAEIDGVPPGIVRPELGGVVRFMRLSVPSLERAARTFVDALGLESVTDYALHTPEHEAMWGLPGAAAKTQLLRAGNFLVELVQYDDPAAQPRPPGYQICDQGFMNIALGYTSTREFDQAFEHAVASGLEPNGKPVEIGMFRVMYVNDADGFSVEMLHARRALWGLSGFLPGSGYVENTISINASAETVWQRLTDHEGLTGWTPFRSRLLRPGAASRNGPGALRELSLPGLTLTEEVTGWEEGARLSYRLRSGAPLRHHRGDMFIAARGDVTDVRWVIRFESALPFTTRLTAFVLRIVFARSLAKLKRQIEAG